MVMLTMKQQIIQQSGISYILSKMYISFVNFLKEAYVVLGLGVMKFYFIQSSFKNCHAHDRFAGILILPEN